MIIGICGKSGSGKSTFASNILSLYDGIHLDVDKIGHSVLLMDEVKKELVSEFGSNIIKDNQISRKRLALIVFSSKEAMDKLSNITWKHMEKKIDEIIEENKNRVVILDWLLLPRTNLFNRCDVRILLDVPYEERKRRAISRDNISEEEFDLRDSSSIDYDRENFDYVIDDYSKNDIMRMVKI